MPTSRMPAVYLPHGGGPWPFVSEPLFGPAGQWDDMAAYMHALGSLPPSRPRAVLLVSAHWEEEVPTVLASEHPPMLYDYSGFPEEAYRVEWPAPGAPEVAQEVQDLLNEVGIASGANSKRGFDHGAFVPLKLGYPNADVPTLQLSLQKGLDPARHIAIGRAIEPLRDRGVFIIGSGMSYHNMRGLIAAVRGASTPREDSKAFDDWLEQSLTASADRREQALVEWQSAPAARACHPREEHLIPLHVVAGAAGNDSGSLPYRDVVMGVHLSSVHFG